MTIYGRKIAEDDLQIIAGYMDDEIRETLHSKIAPCTPEEFLTEYIKADPDSDFLEILRNEFDFEA